MRHKVIKNKKGIPYVRLYRNGEPHFFITPGEIVTSLRKRKAGIYVESDHGILFTCPKCKGVNKTYRKPFPRWDSILCKRCERHLFCLYHTLVPKYYPR